MPTASIEQMFDEAVRQHQAGQVTEAAAFYRQILAQNPNHLNALQLLGVASGQLNRPDLAIDFIRRAIEIRSDVPEYHFNLGVALADNGQPEQAIDAYRQVLALKPDHVGACHNLAAALNKAGRVAEAIEAHQRLVQLTADNADAWNNLGMLLSQQQNFSEATAAYQQAVRLMPGANEIYNNLGNAMCNTGRFDEALAFFQQALQLKPDAADVHQNIALSLIKMGRPAEAIAVFDRVIQLKPDWADAHWSLAFALLLIGDFEPGWIEHEWRLQLKESLFKRRHADRPRWDGGDLRGKTILLHGEQGLGDTILFIRYVPMVMSRGGRVLLECPEELTPLLKGFPGPELVSPSIKQFDVQCPLPSLPLAFGTRLDSIPRTTAYLKADPALVHAWEKKLRPSAGRLRVGLTWAGRPTHLNDRNRSMSLAHFAPLARSGVDFYSLQKGPAAGQVAHAPAALELFDLTADLHNFADTAALVSHLDLIISADTAVVHLAGAMGKPVWVLLPFSPDWRWLINRSDSPWYPSARLFRQKTTGDWAGVINEVAHELDAVVQARNSNVEIRNKIE